MRVLITGGAGFIGSYAAEELLAAGHAVRILDRLDPQVHDSQDRRPDYLTPDAELQVGDVRDSGAVKAALEGVDAVVHLAAAVGVGQSMYEIRHYVDVNDCGTATLLEALAERPVGRLVIASSMSVYGEGLMRGAEGSPEEGAARSVEQLREGRWEPTDAHDRPLQPVATPEWKRPNLQSVYAVCKYAQEQLCLSTGAAYGMSPVALRFFNVYGPRQALSNPYTGVLAIFASRLLNAKPPLIYEDGEQRRDFVHVRDVARAVRAAVERDGIGGQTYNIGSGAEVTIRQIADALCRAMDAPDIAAEITGRFRVGDIRHCFADIARARSDLGYAPREEFEAGLAELADWVAGETAADKVEAVDRDLQRRGLVA